MKNSKNKRMTTMILVLVGLLIIAYKVLFVAPVDDTSLASDNIVSGERVVSILREVESVNFDMSVFADAKFLSLQSIETPLPILPIGKKNPFSPLSN